MQGALLDLTFPALPYGRSDVPTSIPVLDPLPGDSGPPSAVVLDTYSSVSGTGFTRDTTHFVVGSASAKWSHNLWPIGSRMPTTGIS